jgi:hypothetical protein
MQCLKNYKDEGETMNDVMKDLVKKNLKLVKNKLSCKHDSEVACSDCLKNISGDVSGISGNVSEIIKILSEVREQ